MSSNRRSHANKRNPKKAVQRTGNSPARQAQPSRPQQQAIPFPLNIEATYTETKIESFKGPIPHPEVLQKYDLIEAGMANRIVAMAEKEQDHRHGIVERAVDATIASDKRGQYLAGTIAIAVLIVAVVLGLAASPWAGVIIGGLDLATVVGLFLKREHDQKKPDAE